MKLLKNKTASGRVLSGSEKTHRRSGNFGWAYLPNGHKVRTVSSEMIRSASKRANTKIQELLNDPEKKIG